MGTCFTPYHELLFVLVVSLLSFGCTTRLEYSDLSLAEPVKSDGRRILDATEHKATNIDPASGLNEETNDAASLFTLRRLHSQAMKDAVINPGPKCNAKVDAVYRSLCYDPETKTWTLNDNILKMLNNDVMKIVKCTDAGQTIAFDVTKEVKVAGTLRIDWPLKVIGKPVSAPAEQEGCTMTCPDAGTLFALRSSHITIANMTIANCESSSNVITSQPPPGKKAKSMEAEIGPGKILFEKVLFTKNIVASGLRLIKFTLSPAVTVILQDSAFTDNICYGFSCTAFAPHTILRNFYVSGNVGKDANLGSATLAIITGSNTTIIGMLAENNKWRVLTCEKKSSVHIRESVFRNNVMPSDQWPESVQSGGAVLYGIGEALLTIKNSVFTNNKARNGGSIFVQEKAKADMHGVIFDQHSLPNGNGSSVALKGGLISCKGCEFKNCLGSNGGCIYANNGGSVDMVECTISNNKADNGSFLYASGEVKSTIKQSTCDSGSASSFGGVFYIAKRSTLAVTKVYFGDNTARVDGGAIYSYKAVTLSLEDCIFNENTAKHHGGAVCAETNSVLNIDNTKFATNSATSGGALFLNKSCDATIIGGTFEDNTATSTAGGLDIRDFSDVVLKHCTFENNKAKRGGAMHTLYSSKLIIEANLFSNNEAKSGGGCFLHTAALTITSSEFLNNQATDAEGGGLHLVASSLSGEKLKFDKNSANTNGGGLYTKESKSFDLKSSSFTNNKARDGGGACIFASTASLTDHNSFSENIAGHHGGGVFIRDTKLIVDGSDFEKNKAYSGGGLHSRDGNWCTITNCKFNDNECSDMGGGAFIKRSGNLSFNTSTFNANKAGNGGGLYIEGTFGTIGDLTFTSNTAAKNGGGARIQLTKYRASGMKFTYNQALGGNGGGLSAQYGQSVAISNCIANSNKAIQGGGMNFKFTDKLDVLESSVNNNDAMKIGGGIAIQTKDANAKVSLAGTVTQSNTAPKFPNCGYRQGKEYDECPPHP